MKDKLRNLAASVRDRLLQFAKRQQVDFQLLLMRYGLERLLYRLSQSPYQKDFILKGALLFALWSEEPHRPTKDLDLLGRGEKSPERMSAVFGEIITHPVEDDGLLFSQATLHAERIKEDEEYEGVRVRCDAQLENARITMQIDVGFGDAVTPAPTTVTFPTLLAFPAPMLLAYPMETVVAEKFQAMVKLGIANSRMKDYFDLWVLARRFAFDGPTLSCAVQATFSRRRTDLPSEPPIALSDIFTNDSNKQRQWQAFIKKNKLQTEGADLNDVIAVLRNFLMPPAKALAEGSSFEMDWPASGSWMPRAS